MKTYRTRTCTAEIAAITGIDQFGVFVTMYGATYYS